MEGVEEIKIGNMDLYEGAWYEALKCLAIKKISEVTGEPAKLATGGFCDDDEALHVVTLSGKVFHVCYSDVTDVSAIEEIRCPKCGQWVTVDFIEEHQEFLCIFEEEEEVDFDEEDELVEVI